MKFPFSSANDNKLFCGDMCLRLWGLQQELKSKQICKSGTHTVSAVLSLCCDIHPQWKHKQRAADGCISYRPCLHFLTNKYNLVSPTEMWKYCCAHSGRSAASALAALVHAPAFTPGNDRLLLYTFRNDGNHGSLILTISPTSNTLRAAKIQPPAFTGALRVESADFCRVPGELPGRRYAVL